MYREKLMKEYIQALRVGKGYEWINQHGFDLNKDDLIKIIKELDYAIGEDCINPDVVYDTAADELVKWYFDYEEE